MDLAHNAAEKAFKNCPCLSSMPNLGSIETTATEKFFRRRTDSKPKVVD